MPLKHSKTPAAFKKNVETEIEHGKPQKQAVAIAYSEKAKAEHKKHVASGGPVDGCEMCEGGQTAANEKEPMKLHEGGEADPDDELHETIGKEMMDHIHSGNHKGLMDSLKAAIDMHKNRSEAVDEEEEEQEDVAE
jgi:hypothetical protein